MKKVLVVEDNQKAAQLVRKILHEIENSLEVVIAYDYNSAKQMLINGEYQLFVVDIILNNTNPHDATGLDFVQFLRGFKKYQYTPVVITTSVAEMKEHAYDNLDCYKYLEKPYDYNRAKEVLKKALEMPLEYQEGQFFYIRYDGIVRAIKYMDIVAVYYENRKISIQLVDGMIRAYYKSLSEVYRELPQSIFIRCSKDVIVNKKYIDYIDTKNGKIQLIKPYQAVDIGFSYKRKVVEELINA